MSLTLMRVKLGEDGADKPVPGRYPQRERGAQERFGFAGMAGADNDTSTK
jgi:hypothetical protein